MQVMITGRHVEITPALRRYVESRAKRLGRFGLKLGDMQVILSVEKYRHTAEVVLPLDGVVIQGKTSTTEMYASIDQLFDKVCRQVVKRKEKLANHKPKSQPTPSRAVPRRAPIEPMDIETIRVPLHHLTLLEAKSRLERDPQGLVIFRDASTDRVHVMRRLENGSVQLFDPQPS
jgi:putative sigma-54 modulation protein